MFDRRPPRRKFAEEECEMAKKCGKILSGIGSFFKKIFRAVPKWLRVTLACVLGTVLIAGAALSITLHSLRTNGYKQFAPAPTEPPAATAAPERESAAPSAEPTPTPTLSPLEELEAEADESIMKDIVNVLMIGVDYSAERVAEDWDGKQDFHADVMIVMAVNFTDHTVDLISLPRDTYAKIPGVDGKYKLNCSIDCGGGWPTEGGFEKVCEAAEWMLGGIPVDYYYAVSMPVVKDLVNIIGGVNYDVEMDFTMMGREYKAGYQYMDGQAVLDYCRVRKGIVDAGDEFRVNRQKEIMLALFEEAKSRKIITKIPQIIDTFQGDLYTNCTYAQTAALALFAYDLQGENVRMHSMGGTYYDIFNYLFCLTDQAARVELIKEIYGVDVEEEWQYTDYHALEEWGNMLSNYYLTVTKDSYAAMSAAVAQDIADEAAAAAAAEAAAAAAAAAAEDPEAEGETVPPAEVPAYTPRFTADQRARAADMDAKHKIMSDGTSSGKALIQVCGDYKQLFEGLAAETGYAGVSSWYVPLNNAIAVNFN